MTLKAKLMAGFAVPVLAFLIISGVVYNGIHSMIDAEHWVEHTHKVIGEGKQILSSMVDMETGMRGFLVAGKDEFLEPYVAGQKTFSETINELKQTVSDNPAQVGRLNEVESLQNQWLSNAAKPQIAARREVAKGAVASKYFAEVSSRTVGKEMFDGFRASLGKLNSAFIKSNNKAGLSLVQSILLSMVNMETGQRGFLLSGQEGSLEPYIQGQKDFKKYVARLRSYLNSNGTATLRSYLNQSVAKSNGWVSKAADPEINARREMNKFTTTLSDVTAIIEKGAGKRAMDAIRVKLAEFIGEEQKLIVVRTEEAESAGDNTITVTIIGTLLAIIFVVVVSFFLIRGIQRQIGGEPEEMEDISQRLSGGDLTVQMDNTGNETGVYEAMGKMVTNLSSIVNEVRDASNSIGLSASEIAKGNLDLSQRTEEAASSLEETASSMEEMTSTVKQNADNARQANQLAISTREQAEKGGEVVGNAVGAMSEITESSKKIADIIGVIDEIAFQTNLLALNAAVEAARAGEQGRGFAVVASEVRTLAGRSADAAKEIKGLINDSVEKVEQGSDLVNKSGETLEEIVISVKKVTDIISEIAASSQEQANGIEQVNSAVMQMDEMTQQNAALVEEATAASRSMEEQAQGLNKQMEFFTVDGSGTSRKAMAPSKKPAAKPVDINTEREARKPTAPTPKPQAARSSATGTDDSEWDEF